MKRILTILTIMHCALCIMHSQNAIPRNVADAFGNLLVYHNDRICPLQTLARDYTIKLTGKPTYNDFTAEQVLTGFLFYYDEWAAQPMFKIKGKEVRQTLGIEGKYARMNDFISNRGYKLTGTRGKNYTTADEKYNLALMNATGALYRIFPYQTQQDTTHNANHNYELCIMNYELINWFSLSDDLPHDMPQEQWLFIRKSMNLVAEYIAMGDNDKAIDLLHKIRLYQDRELGTAAPSEFKLQAERIYNHFNYNRLFAIILMMFGIITFIWHNISSNKTLIIIEWIILTLTALYLTTAITLRGIIAGHFPLANGFETMQFLSLIAALIPFIFTILNRYRISTFDFQLPTFTLISGIALMVATMSELNPRITLLMPVLQSPLLSIHVMVIMISYALFALLVFNSISNLIKMRKSSNNYELCIMNYELNILALFLLTAGIFIGAIWANVSWGRYWGWDPKEVWALITMLIYSLPLHRASLPIFRNPRFLNWYLILAFLSVIITYFGVNFLLGGLHSYA